MQVTPPSLVTNGLWNVLVSLVVWCLLFRSIVMEARALSVNPLERVVKVVRRGKDLGVQTTNVRLAQRYWRSLFAWRYNLLATGREQEVAVPGTRS
jgi:hypothetical protein